MLWDLIIYLKVIHILKALLQKARMDHILISSPQKVGILHVQRISFPKFQWQKSFHDHYIRNQNDFDTHMNYIVYNPKKHNLPNDWPYIYTNSNYDHLTDECLSDSHFLFLLVF